MKNELLFFLFTVSLNISISQENNFKTFYVDETYAFSDSDGTIEHPFISISISLESYNNSTPMKIVLRSDIHNTQLINLISWNLMIVFIIIFYFFF